VSLDDVEESDAGDDDDNGDEDDVESNGVEGETKDEGREEEEHADEVDYGKPGVVGRGVTQRSGHRDRPAHPGDGVEDNDTGQVEQKVDQSDLYSLAFVGPVSGETSE